MIANWEILTHPLFRLDNGSALVMQGDFVQYQNEKKANKPTRGSLLSFWHFSMKGVKKSACSLTSYCSFFISEYL